MEKYFVILQNSPLSAGDSVSSSVSNASVAVPFTETSSPSSEGGPYREACWISRISSFQHRISNSSPIQTNRPTSLFHQSDEIESSIT